MPCSERPDGRVSPALASGYYPYVDHPIGYDATMTYKLSSDVWTPYYSFGRYGDLRGTDPASRTHSWNLSDRRAALVAIISNCVAWRMRLVSDLNASGELPVVGFGECFGSARRSARSKPHLLRAHAFALAAENSRADDYVTEKVYDALAAGALPVYFGARNFAEFVPNGSVIDGRRFRTPRRLMRYLAYLARNASAYNEWHVWRSRPLPEWFRERFDVPGGRAEGARLAGGGLRSRRPSAECRLCVWAADKLSSAAAGLVQRYRRSLLQPARTVGAVEAVYARMFNDTVS